MAMAPEILTFMPHGDVTLILIRHIVEETNPPATNKNNSPAVEDLPALDEDAEIEAALGIEPEAPTDAEENILYYAPDAPGAEDGPFYPPPPRARGSNASRRDRSASPPASFWAALKRQAAQVNLDVVEDETPPEPAKEPEKIVVASLEVQCIVSSHHLMLASRYFETILNGEFAEARKLRATGHVEISFLEEDFDSMVILLNIIHGASRKVPRTIGLEGLSKLAVLVSKFGMLESVEFFSDTWIDHLQREGLPKAYTREVLRLLYVFWVFDREREFGYMTKLAQREADEGLEEDVKKLEGLRIPGGIIDAIKTTRESAISTAIAIIHAMITKYMDGSALCDAALDEELRYACDAMVLGSLLKSSRKIGIWPKPDAPFPGRKWRDLAKAIRGIKVLDVCNKTSSRRWNSHGPAGNAHGLEEEIKEKLKEVEMGLEGLKLGEFAKKSEEYIPVFVPEVPAPVSPVVQAQSNLTPKTQTNGHALYTPTAYVEGEFVEVKPEEERRAENIRSSIPLASSTPPLLSKSSPTINTSKPVEPTRQEAKITIPTPESTKAPQQTRGRSPATSSIREEIALPQMKEADKQSSLPSLFSWPSTNSRDTPKSEATNTPRSQQSSGFIQQETQAQTPSPRNSIHEVQVRKPVPSSTPLPQNQTYGQNLNGPVTSTTTPSPTTTKGSSTSYFPQPIKQEAQVQAGPSRNSVHEAATVKPSPIHPTEQNSHQNQIRNGHTNISVGEQAQAQPSPRNSVYEVSTTRPMPHQTQNQNQNRNGQTNAPAAQAPKKSSPPPQSPREDQVAASREVSKVIAADKKLTRTPSYPQMPVDREDVKSPAPVVPRVVSMDESALMEGVSLLPPHNGRFTNSNSNAFEKKEERKLTPAAPTTAATERRSTAPVPVERKSPSPPTSIVSPVPRGRDGTPIVGGRESPTTAPTTTVVKGRESPLKQVQLVGAISGVENEVVDIQEEVVWTPPQNFRVRKGKKIFSNRFS